MKTVRLALLWHMHQPHYEDAATGRMALPWVRLHAAKDYVDMVERLAAHPRVRSTFNLVPSLLDQVDAYAAGRQDDFQELAGRDADTLDDAARRFYLRHFFSLSPRLGARRWPRLGELRARLREGWAEWPAEQLARTFPPGDLRDLATLFHLGWLDRRHWERCGVAELAARGQDFSEDDKRRVLQAHLDVMARLVPTYREAWAAGRIELSSSPYYHPILPLLLDPRAAWEALPDLELPRTRWHFPADAAWQVRSALDSMQERFGVRPAGMWPSEGSVSQAAAQLLAGEGVTWAASDENVLACSLGIPPGPERAVREVLYQPFAVDAGGRRILFFFRDQELSDRIGFAYQGMPAQAAVADFMGRLENIRDEWRGADDPVVTVALDGENCWEGYEEDGDEFLEMLYGALEAAPWIRCVTFSEAAAECPAAPTLRHLFAGSWIQHNFRVWIGHPEDNTAWDLLVEAREALEHALQSGTLTEDARRDAWRHIGAAEGSDWFWWYGDEHFTPDADIFDRLFRARLEAVYRAVGQPAPGRLGQPIKVLEERQPFTTPVGLVHPVLDGRVSHFYEWRMAGCIEPGAVGGSMHAGRSLLRAAYYGFDLERWYVRLDWSGDPAALAQSGVEAALEIWDPVRVRLWLPGLEEGQEGPLEVERWEEGSWQVGGALGLCVTRVITELSVPLAELGLLAGDRLQFVIRMERRDGSHELVPASSAIAIEVPGEDFEGTLWSA
ncbi:MAG TPA: glycoside hydrolase family 57 protein [Candidatus Saccharimonadales bacterium]|nr:glycoside hydrolase family 57 protein [Candidatus Saccharimonadales bacterium]